MTDGRSPRIHLCLAIMAATIGLSANAYAESCAKLKIASATECSKLQVEFDVSGCDDSLSGKPRIRCKDDGARIKITGKKNRYVAHLTRKSGAWGNDEWTQEAPIEVIARKTASRDKKGEAPAKTKTMRVPTEAGENPSKPAAEAKASPVPPSTEKAEGGWRISANFDAYYEYNFNRPSSPTPIDGTSVASSSIRPPQNALHPFDWYARQLGLNLVEISPKYTRGDVTVFADLDFGQMADISAATAVSGGYAVDEVSKHIGQAILSYSPSAVPGLIFEVGKMATHVGLEVTKAKDNWNYTRSVIFGYAIPLWHTGAHVGYELVPATLVASVYLYNGWNTLTDTNSIPTLGAQLRFTPAEGTTLAYNYIGGPEQAGNNSNWKQVHEANATLSIMPDFAAALELVTGSEAGIAVGSDTVKAHWTGGSLAMKWQALPSYYVSPRFELFRDNQGYATGATGTPQTITTYTLTNGFGVAPGLEVRAEGRLDHSTASRFITKDGTSNDQATVLAAILYSI